MPIEAQQINLNLARFRALLRVCDQRLRAIAAPLSAGRLAPPLHQRMKEACARVTELA